MFNNRFLIHDIVLRLDGIDKTPKTPSREALEPDPCLPARLPSTSLFQLEVVLGTTDC